MRLLLFLPLVELFRFAKDRTHTFLFRFVFGTLVFSFTLILWINAYILGGAFLYTFGLQVGDNIGIVGVPVHISGTGSMYPTFPKGVGKTAAEQASEDVAAPPMFRYPGGFYLGERLIWSHTLRRGDVVSFANAKTAELVAKEGVSTDLINGFVKRVVALPGDTLEIRNGFVLLNGEQLGEPYIASARSTFGGAFLPDCRKFTIPESMIFVMGDNRKASNDSRHDLGLVNISDVTRVLPLELQTPYQTLWRDPSHDFDQQNLPVLNAADYVKKLNGIRSQHDVAPLRYEPKLEQSARLRALNMLKYNDLSFEATRSGYTMQRAVADAGYDNVLLGEAPTLGYYTADELLDNYAEFPSWEKFLLDARYQETGIAAVVGELNGCPVQIVVQHVAGYLPPNYDSADVESWKRSADRLREILPSWEGARNFGAQYEGHKSDYERIIQVIRERIAIADAIYARMSANQWLTNEEKQMAEHDKALYNEQESLAKMLNAL